MLSIMGGLTTRSTRAESARMSSARIECCSTILPAALIRALGCWLECLDTEETEMSKAHFLLTISLVLLSTSSVASQSNSQNNGTIVEQADCPPKTVGTYEQYVETAKSGYLSQIETAKKSGIKLEMPTDFSKRLLSREEFERRKAYTGVVCQRIKYMSDGSKVVGYIWKPKNSEGKKLPLIIFNRGGNRERSKLTPWMAYGFYEFVSNGFIVIGSQYRGVDGGEGKDEYGGADVRDVMNLMPLAISLGYVDMNNVCMFGNSRGGMMTYLSLKNNIPVNAAAVMSGVTDLFGNAEDHPELVTSIYKELIPDFDRRCDEAMRERSVVYWANSINVPVLIMHGGADLSIGAGRTLGFAQKLQELGKTYELIIYAGGDHGLSLNRIESDRRVIEWFRKYMK
jgi:dipeptidyl aminopeptidase/acylaminoacyl peptidase